MVRRTTSYILLAGILLLVGFGVLGASPPQSERPPQPFFQDFFSGAARVLGSPAPEGTELIACIDDCETGFQSKPYFLDAGGLFNGLEVDPSNEALIGRTITFYLVNSFGRIQAVESRPYIGVFDFYVQDLTFVDPLPSPAPTPKPESTPVPTPTASLPIAGDPSVTKFPKLALMAGGAAVVAGGTLLLLGRRKAE